MLPDLIRRGRHPSVGITVSDATITLRVSAQAQSDEDFAKLIQPTVDSIHQSLGDLVFGVEDDELQHAVTKLLRRHRLTMAVSEWGTGGLIADWMQDLAKSPDGLEFAGGFIVSSSQSLASTLGISSEQLAPP